MTAYRAPPDQTGLVLNTGDNLNIGIGGTATDTTINVGIVEVGPGGTATDTTINAGGHENVSGAILTILAAQHFTLAWPSTRQSTTAAN